jgi:hypothetical protein
LQVFWSLLAALVAVSAQVLPPSQNSATSASENLNTAHYYNQNFYARDESRVRQHSTTFGNNAEGTTDVATATSDPLPLPAVDPFYPTLPVHHPHFHRIAPYPVYGPAAEYANALNNVPTVSRFSPLYAALADPLFPYYVLPSSGYYALQPALPVPNTRAAVDDPFLNPAIELPPVQLIDPTLLQPVYSEPPVQTRHSATNNLNRLSAVANPLLASSGSVTDSTAYLRDVLQGVQPIAV